MLTEYLIFNGTTISFSSGTFTYKSIEKIDDNCVHIFMNESEIFAFLGGLTYINGVLKNTADEIIASF